MTRRRSSTITPRPARIETPAERGQALRNWLDVQGISVMAAAEHIGMSRAHLYRYLAGEAVVHGETRPFDLAQLPQEEAERLLTMMGVTDWEAWEILNIPEGNRETFRSFRAPPFGHGRAVQEVVEVQLTEAMVGELPLPRGTTVRIDPARRDDPEALQIVRLEDGRYFSVRPNMVQRAGGTHLGALMSAHF